ncbi:MAG: 50S ribosomal protein L24 [Candidatus Marinimicrobia bacterium]|nr:50S ribosomal protein L24 [Candidatus Neomarinimicrobiota bacterium]|tara:strand:+ start:1372 stop:1677 length:306 start_codon:yes stop_codon:yes gene_type:complete
MKIIKGDTVQIITGTDKGKQGRVLKSYPVKNKILVEGINVVKKHIRPSQENPQGGISEKEMPINISNVTLIFNGEPTKVGYKILEDNKKVRISKKTGEVIQ